MKKDLIFNYLQRYSVSPPLQTGGAARIAIKEYM
jgi:hypothetical protein